LQELCDGDLTLTQELVKVIRVTQAELLYQGRELFELETDPG
jgi:hypothetical protein